MAPTAPSYDPTGGYRNAPTGAPAPPGAPAMPPPDGLPDSLLVVDTGKIAQAVAGFQAAAGDTATAAAAARTGTEGGELGATPWGGDPLGSAFGSQYLPVAQAMDQALGGLAALLSDVADRLSTAKGLYTGAEDFALDTAVHLNSGG